MQYVINLYREQSIEKKQKFSELKVLNIVVLGIYYLRRVKENVIAKRYFNQMMHGV